MLNHGIRNDASSLIDEDGLEKINNDDADNNDEESVELSKDLLHQSKTWPQATTDGHWEKTYKYKYTNEIKVINTNSNTKANICKKYHQRWR